MFDMFTFVNTQPGRNPRCPITWSITLHIQDEYLLRIENGHSIADGAMIDSSPRSCFKYLQ